MTKKGNNIVTKKYLDSKLKRLRDEIDVKFVQFKKELKDELVGIKDEIVGEIKAMREEFDTHQFQPRAINDTFDDHENRLQKLEKPAP
jgi:hypothetical protein